MKQISGYAKIVPMAHEDLNSGTLERLAGFIGQLGSSYVYDKGFAGITIGILAGYLLSNTFPYLGFQLSESETILMLIQFAVLGALLSNVEA